MRSAPADTRAAPAVREKSIPTGDVVKHVTDTAAGCEVVPNAKPENVKAMCESVSRYGYYDR